MDGLAANGKVELRRDYAGPIAVHAMRTVLGLTGTPVDAMLDWYAHIVEAVTRVTAGKPVGTAGHSAFDALRQTLLPVIRQSPEKSLLAAVSEGASGELTEEQIVSNAAILLFGGVETSEGLIANAFISCPPIQPCLTGCRRIHPWCLTPWRSRCAWSRPPAWWTARRCAM